MPALELFHRLAEPRSAEARRLVSALGLLEAVAFRNVAFDSHRDALAARGGGPTPALWDGARLHEGLDAVRAALSGAAHPLAPAPPSFLDAAGAPRLGAFVGALPPVDLAALAGRGLRGPLRRLVRGKRWTYALAASGEVLAAVAVVEAGLFAGGFAWAADRATGAVLFGASAAGLPRRHARVNEHPAAGARARLHAGALSVEVSREATRWTVHAAGPAFAVDAVLDAARAPPPFAFVARLPGGGVRATQKEARLAASGAVRALGRTFTLDGGAGGVDHTAGLLARETAWRWAFAPGAAGAPGFNLCEGFGLAPDDPGENVAFAERPYRLPPVAFEVGGERAPWRVRSAGGEVDLSFQPAGAHREARDLGLLRTRFVQVAGTFSGTLPGAGGGAVVVAGLPGVVEDHWARW